MSSISARILIFAALGWHSGCGDSEAGSEHAENAAGGAGGSSTGGEGGSAAGTGGSTGGLGGAPAGSGGSTGGAAGTAAGAAGAAGSAGSSAGAAGAAGSAGSATGQPPINISFDLHVDPDPPAATLNVRRDLFHQHLANASWLLDTVEPYGVKISFLAVGEFYEFCLEDSEKVACFEVLQRLYASGGLLGTHQHFQKRVGPHDWQDIPDGVMCNDPAEINAVWEDAHAVANEAIKEALGISDDALVASVNAACESVVPIAPVPKKILMAQYGHTIRQGGNDQVFAKFFSHVPWNPFRPGLTPISEDPTTDFVTIPQGMTLGRVGAYKNIWQDGRAPHKKAEFLQLLATWAERERIGAAPKVWSFGWGLHTQDINEGSDSRAAVEEFIPWLHDSVITEASPAGNNLATFASYIDVREAFKSWENGSPGVSSFNYTEDDQDYSAYPYLEWSNRYLRATDFEAELNAPDGVRLFRMAAEGHSLILAISWGATKTVDVSSLQASTLRRVDLPTGDVTDVDAAAALAGPSSTIFCSPDDCDAIVALGTSQPICFHDQTRPCMPSCGPLAIRRAATVHGVPASQPHPQRMHSRPVVTVSTTTAMARSTTTTAVARPPFNRFPSRAIGLMHPTGPSTCIGTPRPKRPTTVCSTTPLETRT